MHWISRNPQGMSLDAVAVATKGGGGWMIRSPANVNSPSPETGAAGTGDQIKDPYQALLSVLGLN